MPPTPNPASLRATARRGVFFVALVLLAPPVAEATPQFARRYERPCGSCHLLPPALNEHGLAFQASGYLLPSRPETTRPRERSHLLPMAAWLTARSEDQAAPGASDLYLPKVELISGGRWGESWSYFVEWRPVSLSLRRDGSLQDRGGRFEDLFVERSLGERHALRVGQFRSLNQVDVSLRLSASEPLLFNNGLPTGSHRSARLASLDRFSPAARSPSIGYSFRSRAEAGTGDGLFAFVSLPFVGELSIPLSAEASREASFELQGPPKGVYVETFNRRGLRSFGGHVFVADEAWLATAVGVFDLRGWLLTGGVGTDHRDGAGSRWRGSAQLERFFTGPGDARFAPGLRVEDVGGDGNRATLVPYLALAAPSTRYTYLLQLEWRSEESGDSLVVDLSAIF
ncbi:MAG: hypothetical protein ACRD2Z_10320 [Thermoanaerobaculia bacterium]